MKSGEHQSGKFVPVTGEKSLTYLVNLINAGGNSRDILFQLVGILAEKVDNLQTQMHELQTRLHEKEKANENTTPELLNSYKACKLLGMCPATLNLYRKKGKIKALRIGKGFMYELNDLLKLGRKS